MGERGIKPRVRTAISTASLCRGRFSTADGLPVTNLRVGRIKLVGIRRVVDYGQSTFSLLSDGQDFSWGALSNHHGVSARLARWDGPTDRTGRLGRGRRADVTVYNGDLIALLG